MIFGRVILIKFLAMAKRIILSDESIDSYGERVLMSGCVLDRFLKNPVMLYRHDSYDKPVIGRWKDVRIEGNQLTAEPEFDLNDEFGGEIARKYEEGFLVASSVGFRVIETSNDPAVMLAGQKYSTITKWELFEASIVPLPANPNAIQMKAYQDEYKVKYSPEAKLILDKFLNSNK
jgi:HK97 family phage prohead protease